MHPVSSFEPIAIIGRGCHLPGAKSISEYWERIRNDSPTIREIPAERFDREMFYDATQGVDFKTYCSKACLVEPVSLEKRLDLPAKWKHHPETVFPDLISVTRDACNDGGRELEGWAGARGGVFVGHTRGGSLSGDFAYASYIAQAAELLDDSVASLLSASGTKSAFDRKRWKDSLIQSVRRDMPKKDSSGGPSLGAPVAALAVAESLCWDGPFMAFNGACASSLQALHAAVLSLQARRIDIAVAAGASCCHSDSLILFAQARSLSAKDTRPFDEDADGLIIGEGCVVLMLKRLSDALKDGDTVHGVIRGVGVASDGKGKSLWAPRKEGQMKAIARAYASRDAMRAIQYVEAHATSTKLGDATEMEALADSFSEVIEKGRKVPVGSVKAIVGHTLESAGLAGLLKSILCMENGLYPAHQRLNNLSQRIPWNDIPFFVPREVSTWTPNEQGERWAAINGFGIGGLNAHVVVQSGELAERKRSISMPSQENRPSNGSAAKSSRPFEIAVIATGCILPNALDWDSFRRIIREDRIGTRMLLDSRWISPPSNPNTAISTLGATIGGFTDDFVYDWRRHKVPPKQLASASPLQFMILEAVDQAIRPSGLLESAQNRANTGVVVGTIFGGDFSNQLQMGLRVPDIQRRLRSLWQSEGMDADAIEQALDLFGKKIIQAMPAFFDETGSFTSSSLASRITKTFDLMGGAVAVDAAHGASGAALMYCVDQLQQTENEFMVCIGAQQDMGPMKFEGWSANGWLGSKHGQSALHPDSDGTFPGEGAAVMLLQKVRHGQTPLSKPLAYVRGIGTSMDTNGDVSFSRSARRANLEAEHRAQPANVRFSPMGVPAIDDPCKKGVRETFGSIDGESDEPIFKTANDSFGHLTGGSGMVECLASIAHAALEDSKAASPMTRNMVQIGSPWECIYSVIIDVLKEKND